MKPSQYLQSNIIKSHGRDHFALMLLRFKGGMDFQKRRKWVTIVEEQITYLGQQHADTMNKKLDPALESYVVFMGFSVRGLRKLNIPPVLQPTDKAFRLGMFHQNIQQSLHDAYLNDNIEYAEFRVPDCLLAIAHNDRVQIETKISDIKGGGLFGQVIDESQTVVEYGFKARDVNDDSLVVGPLGFSDGHSNLKDPSSIFGAIKVLEKFPVEMNNGKKSFGTYLAYRKIEVDNDYFEEVAEDIADRFEMDISFVKALFVGRHQNGTPLVNFSGPVDKTLWSNQDNNDLPFDYSCDPLGNKCPLGAHVRAMNPRVSGIDLPPIIRRSVSFSGIHSDDISILSRSNKGLLFLSYQGSIDNVFLPLFKNMEENLDLLAYPQISLSNLKKIIFPKSWGSSERISGFEIDGQKLVKFRDGAFFYIPSKVFLTNIESFPTA